MHPRPGRTSRSSVGYRTGLVVQRDQATVPFERDESAVGLLREQVGLAAGRIFAGRVQSGEVGPHVIEHAVQHHVDTFAVGGLDQLDEVVLDAQAGVDAEVVDRVVAVGGGVEDRAEREAVRTQLEEVIEPRDQRGQARGGCPVGAGGICPEESQRVDVPPDHVLGRTNIPT